jgi:hypothetical protein
MKTGIMARPRPRVQPVMTTVFGFMVPEAENLLDAG